MSDKKSVLTGLRVSYNGAIDINEFLKEVDSWLKKNGYEKEQKKYKEHLTEKVKKIEWVVEGHRELDKWHESTIVLRTLFDNVNVSSIRTGERRKSITIADVLVVIDGLVESHLAESFYHRRPLYQFIVLLIDKYIYNFWSDKHDGTVRGDCNAMFKHIRSFFSLQKYKFQDASVPKEIARHSS